VKTLRQTLRWVLAVFFVVAGVNHFRTPGIYLGMMPPWVPWPAAVNALVGVAEMLGGLGLVFAPTRWAAGWGLIALLVAIFPANVHVALQGRMPGFDFLPLTLWLRLPFQAVLIAWVWWVAVKGNVFAPSTLAVAPAPVPAGRSRDWLVWSGAGLLAVAVVTVFGPALRGEFLIWDDNNAIFENPHLGGLSWARAVWAFGDSSQTLRYMPLGWLGYSLVFSVGGLVPTTYHATALLVHAANALLLFAALRKLLQLAAPDGNPRWRDLGALFAAAFWALHPLRVEVVAWALTLAYELAWCALLIAFGAFLIWWETRRTHWMVATAVSYAISLLTYPVGLTAWLAFLLLGAWLARGAAVQRWRTFLLALAIPSVLAGSLLLWIRWHVTGPWQPPTNLEQFGLGERLAQAAYSWAYYLWRPWYPVDVAPIYGSLLRIDPLAGRFLLSGLVVAAGSVAAWMGRGRWPGFSAGWWAIAAVSLPVMGLTEHPFFTSDRFTGLPGIVLSVMLAFAWVQLRRPIGRWFIAGAGAAVIVGWMTISAQQVPRWHDTTRLFGYVASITPDPMVQAECHLRRGLVAEAAGRHAEARRECDLGLASAPNQRNLRALARRLDDPAPPMPRAVGTQLELTRYALDEGDFWAAEAHLQRAVQLAPRAREPHIRLALLLLEQGEPREALRHFLWVSGSGSKNLDRRFLQELETVAGKCRDPGLAQAARRRL
jgi:uncharacterized membrane protein/tetratricopeptide (TPR) repeat protein